MSKMIFNEKYYLKEKYHTKKYPDILFVQNIFFSSYNPIY